jgi:hypothetical protein
MNDEGAAGALVAAVISALRAVPELSGAFDGAPIQAADPHAIVDMGPEVDWGHKSGAGAELRFAVLILCGGEAPGRLRRMTEAARAVLDRMDPELTGWRLVSLVMVRARAVREPGSRWLGVIDYRARLLAS